MSQLLKIVDDDLEYNFPLVLDSDYTYVSSPKLDWENSKAACEELGMTLSTELYPEENTFIKGKGWKGWIGLKKDALGVWRWLTG